MGLASKEGQGMNEINFLSSVLSIPKKIFQKDFPTNFSKEIFQGNFPEKFYRNFLAFQEAINKLMVGDEMYEKTKEDARTRHQDYPSA